MPKLAPAIATSILPGDGGRLFDGGDACRQVPDAGMKQIDNRAVIPIYARAT